MISIRLALCILLVAAAEHARAADTPRDISPLIKPILEKHKLPGMAGLILDGESISAIGVNGVRKSGGTELIARDDLFHLGSCTKSMTATLIGMLVEEGKLSWSSTIGEIFADKKMDPLWRAVTLEQVLTHHGGAPADLNPGGLWSRLCKRKGTPIEQRIELLEGVLGQPPAAAPGKTYIYSNAGYAIAGAMAEKVTGTAWEELMRKRLFDPLGMSSAGFGAPGKAGSVDQPWGHRANGTPVEPGPNADNPPAIGPAGTVHSTLGDWSKYIALHLQAAQGQPRLLKSETFKKLHTPGVGDDSYAMGWGVAERGWAAGRTLSHSGSNTMWYVVVWIAPGKNFAVLAASNQGGDVAAKACDDLCGALIADHNAHASPKPGEKK